MSRSPELVWDIPSWRAAGFSRASSGRSRTEIVLCNGYNGLGVNTFLKLFRMFPNTFDRCVLVGAVDAGSCNGADELERLGSTPEEQA